MVSNSHCVRIFQMCPSVLLQAKLGLPPEQQLLVYGSGPLKDGRTLHLRSTLALLARLKYASFPSGPALAALWSTTVHTVTTKLTERQRALRSGC